MEKKELTDALTEYKSGIEAKMAEIKKANDAEKVELKAQVTELETKRDAMQTQLDELDVKLQAVNKEKKEELKSFIEGFQDLVASKEFKEARETGFRTKSTFEVKASMSDITGTVNLTRQDPSINFAPTDDLAFIPGLTTMTLGAGKNTALWVEGSYTSNVGYVGEGVAASTGDTGATAEKTRGMAKISAKLILTAEMLEDAPLVASMFRTKMQTEELSWLDDQVYSGNGSDATNPTHIYGIQGHATAYDSTIAGATVAKPNIGDLVDAALLQGQKAKQKGIKKVWMSPLDFFKFRTTKDDDGNRIFIKDVNGKYTISGLQVVVSNKVTNDTMLFADPSKIKLWWKRKPEIKFGQSNGTDIASDQYTAFMFARVQVVVEGPDKTALIYVSSVSDAITALTKA